MCEDHLGYFRDRQRIKKKIARDTGVGFGTKIYEWKRNLWYRYGLTEEDITSAIIRQNGMCAICGKPPALGGGYHLVVDHDHETGAFRGLIHQRENRAIGMFDDSAQGIRRLMEYLLG
jgi:hypothetical protein